MGVLQALLSCLYEFSEATVPYRFRLTSKACMESRKQVLQAHRALLVNISAFKGGSHWCDEYQSRQVSEMKAFRRRRHSSSSLI